MAYNLITGSGNFTNTATEYLIGSASWTGSTTRDELYVQGQLKTDIFYDVLGTSSLFVAKMNYENDGDGYVYEYTGALSGSVTELASGSFSDYYVNTFWGVTADILYTFDPVTTRSIDADGQWQDAAGGAWKTGYKFAFLYRKSDDKIVSVCTVYPVSASDGSTSSFSEYVSPGVDGYFCTRTTAAAYYTDNRGEAAATSSQKKAELRFISNDVPIATTTDSPPEPPEPEVTFSYNPKVYRFSSAIILTP